MEWKEAAEAPTDGARVVVVMRQLRHGTPADRAIDLATVSGFEFHGVADGWLVTHWLQLPDIPE